MEFHPSAPGAARKSWKKAQAMLTVHADHRVLTRAPAGPVSPVAMLAADIGAACEGSRELMGGRITAALQRVVADPMLLTAEQRTPGDRCYARHVVHADPAGRFTVLALVWMPGQFSPPHAHQTWCGFAVYDGLLTETEYTFDGTTQKATALHTADRHAGYCTFGEAGLDQIHRLGNAGVRPAISLHVYGVEGGRIRTHVNRLVDVV
jgi:predicted metal-dependent enzyme (double-stranded beta helix superfamily)